MRFLLFAVALLASAPCWADEETKAPAMVLKLEAADDVAHSAKTSTSDAIWLRLTIENRSDVALAVTPPLFPGGEARGWSVVIAGPGGAWSYIASPVIAEPLRDEHFVSLAPGASVGQLIDIGGAVPLAQSGPQARPNQPLRQTRGTFSVSAFYSMSAQPTETRRVVWQGQAKSATLKITINK